MVAKMVSPSADSKELHSVDSTAALKAALMVVLLVFRMAVEWEYVMGTTKAPHWV